MTISIPSRILITGCTGFVGGYLVEQCRIRYPQAELFGLSGRPALHTATPGMSDVKLLVADITQPEAIRQVVAQAQPDLIIQSSCADLGISVLEGPIWNTQGQCRRDNTSTRSLAIRATSSSHRACRFRRAIRHGTP